MIGAGAEKEDCANIILIVRGRENYSRDDAPAGIRAKEIQNIEAISVFHVKIGYYERGKWISFSVAEFSFANHVRDRLVSARDSADNAASIKDFAQGAFCQDCSSRSS